MNFLKNIDKYLCRWLFFYNKKLEAELDAMKAADAINDVESEEYKVNYFTFY